jgi:hypothetical protein
MFVALFGLEWNPYTDASKKPKCSLPGTKNNICPTHEATRVDGGDATAVSQ